MKRSKILLKNMPDIIATCIILHGLCFVNNERIEDEWIIEAKNKLPRGISKGEIREEKKL